MLCGTEAPRELKLTPQRLKLAQSYLVMRRKVIIGSRPSPPSAPLSDGAVTAGLAEEACRAARLGGSGASFTSEAGTQS